MKTSDTPALLTPAEVARLFSCDAKTVTRWVKDGKLTAIKTPGGHRRLSAAQPLIAEALAYRDGGAS
jgi:excisionase family DNA binding protein